MKIRLKYFITSFVIALVIGFIMLWFAGMWNVESPLFYSFVIPLYFLGAVIIALTSSLEG